MLCLNLQYYNTWLSLLTGLLSIACMMLISLPIAMITIAIVMFFYLVVLYRSPGMPILLQYS